MVSVDERTGPVQAETGKKRRDFFQQLLMVSSLEKSPKCDDSGVVFALFLVLVVIFFPSDLIFFKKTFLFSEQKTETQKPAQPAKK